MRRMSVRSASVTCIVGATMAGWLLPAAPASAGDLNGSLAFTTDYIYRGLSQTDGQPAAQAGVQFHSLSGWNAGLWGSSVDFQNGSGNAYELDLQAGYGWSLSQDWSMQLGYVHYAYLDDNDAGYDYDEVSASISYQQRATASVSWSPNTSKHTYWGFISDKRALAYELSMLQPLQPHWSLLAGVGYYDLSDLVDTGYWYWSAGVAFTWQDMQVDLLHIDTDNTATRLFDGGSRWTAALTWRF
jgi:uncharacterized protein (TIGR02001 family)